MNAKNTVEVFRHLPQYEGETRIISDHVKPSMHPAIYEFGVKYLAGEISGGNARCIAMPKAFQEAIRDQTLVRDLPAKISSYVSFFTQCKPLSIRMGNAIGFLKSRLAQVMRLGLPESEAKSTVCSEIDCFITDKIICADKVIVSYAATKIMDGDVLLTYGYSSVVEMSLLHAHELGKQFRVVIADSNPQLEGQALRHRLQAKGLTCTNDLSHIMHHVTRVFMGAASVLCNGTVYSRVGTTCVAMVANAFGVPVLICCESYKFHVRAQRDAIFSNQLGDPDDVNYVDNCAEKENLQLLNLMYDAIPSEYVSMIVTDYGIACL